jgi:hypothetical protein
MQQARRFLVMSAALAATAFACSNPTAPGFSAKFGAPSWNSQTETAAVNVSGSQIVVTGVLVVPDPCYSGAARLEESGSTLTLHLTAGKHTSGSCAAVLAYLPYTVTVSASGTHDVVVLHETIGPTPPPREVARARVTVP